MRAARLVAAAIAVAGAALAGSALIGPASAPFVSDAGAQGRPPARAVETNVDVELVIAVDVSYSMDPDEQVLQREGYITGLTSQEFLDALASGHARQDRDHLFRMGGRGRPEDRGAVAAHRRAGRRPAFADEIAQAPYRRAYRTSISGALRFAQPLFEGSGFRGLRRVIDVSGDGANNQGLPVTLVRDEVLERGVTINGLPILLKRPSAATMDIENLDVYYEDCVIGGPGAFMIPIKERDQFREATRTKLVLEIAGREPPVRIVPAAASAPRVSCLIGERMWQERWGGGGLDFR